MNNHAIINFTFYVFSLSKLDLTLSLKVFFVKKALLNLLQLIYDNGKKKEKNINGRKYCTVCVGDNTVNTILSSNCLLNKKKSFIYFFSPSQLWWPS